ncbi:MAG: glycosyltransferase family 4 protein, partial [Phaeodactylibacter sp.]|nr:glycosyltransferase family 4 protein [Phaeodactylibacter sp.]
MHQPKLPKLAIVSTHPIQYLAPLFQLMEERGKVAIKVFYSWGKDSMKKFDKGFGKTIEWDIPLLQGYTYEFAENQSKAPGTHHYKGIQTPKLAQQILDWQADALLIFGWNYQGHLQVMRQLHGKIPILFRGDSTLLDERPGMRRLLRRVFLRWVYRFVDKAFYVGQNNRKYLLAHGMTEQQLIFAPHAIDNARFADAPEKNYQEQAEAWRRELGYSSSDKVLLFAGKLEPKKAPSLLLQAVQTHNRQHAEPWKLLFIGNGVLEAQLQETAQGDPHIQFAGFQNQSRMPVAYRVGDLFCLPSNGPGETWGLAINEAMASGRPVIASSKTGCAIDLIQPDSNGYYFEAGSLQELVQVLEKAR